MATIRSKIFRGSALVSFIFLFSACSEKATCALEGCTEDGNVKLQGEQQASEDARPDELAAAKAEIEKAKKALDEAFVELKDRVIFNESVDKLQNDMLHLHEQRIAALELRVSAIDTKIVKIEADIAANTQAIADNAQAIVDLEAELREVIEMGDAATKASLEEKIAALKAEQDAARALLDARVVILETFKTTQLALNSTMDAEISTLQTQVAGLLTTIGNVGDQPGGSSLYSLIATAQQGVNVLNSSLDAYKIEVQGKLSDLQGLLEGKITTAQATAIQQSLAQSKTYTDQQIATMQVAIDGINNALASKSSCSIGNVYTVFFIKYRDVTCDGKSFRVLGP